MAMGAEPAGQESHQSTGPGLLVLLVVCMEREARTVSPSAGLHAQVVACKGFSASLRHSHRVLLLLKMEY